VTTVLWTFGVSKSRTFLISWMTVDFSRKPPRCEFDLSYILHSGIKLRTWLFCICPDVLTETAKAFLSIWRYCLIPGRRITQTFVTPFSASLSSQETCITSINQQNTHFLLFVVCCMSGGCVRLFVQFLCCVVWYDVSNVGLTSIFRWLFNRWHMKKRELND
jgi:hypothetical protein